MIVDTTDTAALLALASRVEAGKTIRDDIRDAVRLLHIDTETAAIIYDLWRVGAYLDAIESLRQRVLPGWCIWRLREMPNGTWLCLKRRANTDRENGFAPTIAQAYCAAVLRAVAANKETDR